MTRLFEAPQNPQSVLYQQCLAEINRAIAGETSQFLYNLDYYYALAPHERYAVAQRAESTLRTLAAQYEWKGKVGTLLEGVDEEYLAIIDELEQRVVVGIDIETEGYPSALYTTSANQLDLLVAGGHITAEDKEKALTTLRKSKMPNALKDGTFATIRLDPQGEVNGVQTFKLMIPQKNLDIGVGKKHVAIPVPFMYLLADRLSTIFAGQPFRFTKSTVQGQKTHVVTTSEQVVKHLYAGVDDHLLAAKLAKTPVGYNPVRLRFYAFDVEASLHSLGIASFRPEMLDMVQVVADTEIDKSRYAIDFAILRGIFKTKIRSAKADELATINFFDLSGYSNLKDRQEALFALAEDTDDRTLHAWMLGNPKIFGDLQKALATRERVMPKFLKGMKLITLPVNEEQRVALITKLMDQGVVKFTAVSKKGGVFERVVSNNKVALERMLGADYVKGYESIRNKLYFIRDLVQTGEQAVDVPSMEKIAVDYNLTEYVDTALLFSEDPKQVIQTLNDAIEQLKAKAATRTQPANSVIYRNLRATEASEFYGNINVTTLIAIEFSEV